MFCINCGKPVPDTDRFCSFCGAALTPPARSVDRQSARESRERQPVWDADQAWEDEEVWTGGDQVVSTRQAQTVHRQWAGRKEWAECTQYTEIEACPLPYCMVK